MRKVIGKESNVAENRNQKPTPEPDDKEQSQRFIEDAKRLEADEDGDAFMKAMTVLAPSKDKPKPESND